MTIRSLSFASGLFAVSALAAGSPASAQSSTGLTLTFAQPTLTAVQGQTVTFVGTLTNTGSSDLLLNADFLDIDPPLTADDTPFAAAFEAPDPQPALAPGMSYTGDLFTITAPPSSPTGAYFGTFAPEGGASASDVNILDIQSFTVQVVPVPEAGTALGLGMGLALLGGLYYGRRRRASMATSRRTSASE